MAGIGFELEKILDRGTISSLVQGYVYSALIYCGPWIFTIISLSLVSWTMQRYLEMADVALVRVAVIYIFCFSLITVGPLSMVITRHISDLIYENKEQKISGVFLSSTVFLFIVQSVTVIPFVLYMEGGWMLRANAFTGYLLVSFIWHLMVFITAVKDYKSVAVSFGLGMFLALALGEAIGRRYGAEGVLLGFNLGLAVICFSLAPRVFVEFSYPMEWDFTFLKAFARYWDLALFGLFYNLGIWIDKIIFWYSPDALRINNLLHAHHPYDSSMFFAYLTTVPSLAYFFVAVETEYYRHYRKYYQSILQKRGFAEIESAHRGIKNTITGSMTSMARFQLVLSLTAMFFAPRIIEVLKLDWSQLYIFRIGILAAMLQVFILLGCVMIFYFDFRRDTLFISVLLFLTNAVFTAWSLRMGFRFHGYGYFASTAVTFVATLGLLGYRMKYLHFFTFCREALR